MSYIPLEKLLKNSSESIYKLVMLAAARAVEITQGSPPLVEKPGSAKPGSIALEEIAAGKVKIKVPAAKRCEK